MTDAALRALEREARARPADLAAGWAYAIGLERAGERRALWLELCRLARADDARAVAAVDGWLPGLGGTTPRAPSLRAPKVARVALIEHEAFEDHWIQGAWSAGDRNILVSAGAELLFFDVEAEVLRRRQRDVFFVQAHGDDALVVTQDRTVFVRSLASDDATAGAGLAGEGLVTSCASWGDRLVVVRGDGQMQALDAGASLGRVLWREPVQLEGVHGLSDSLVFGDEEVEVVVRDLATGRERWRLELRPAAEQLCWWEADAHGLLVHEWTTAGARTLATRVDGEVAWSVDQERALRCHALTPDLFVVAEGGDRLVGRARLDGRALWSFGPVGVDERRVVARRADATLYVAAVERGAVRLVALDLATGRAGCEGRARLPSFALEGSVDALIVHGSGVDVVVGTPSSAAAVVRFAD